MHLEVTQEQLEAILQLVAATLNANVAPPTTPGAPQNRPNE